MEGTTHWGLGADGIQTWFNGMNGLTEKVVVQVEALAEPVLASEGITLIDVEFRRERQGRTLRLVIDKPEGVTLDDCSWVSGQLGDLFDAKLSVDGPYHLEVSSPGLDRPLKWLRHFEHFRGRRAVVWTKAPVEGKREWRGTLEGVSSGEVLLDVEDQQVRIPYDGIAKARLDY